MTFILRPYQRESIDAVYDYWQSEGGSPLIVLPTGTGKSGVAGTLTRELFDNYGDMRILNVTHVAELIEQSYQELLGLWQWAPAGVYSAGLGRRDLRSQILFAGIQSIHKHVKHLGQVDLLMVDEAHLIPRKADTMYGRFIADLREANPDMRLIGLTATPYRTDSGRLDEGDDRMFDAVAYEYGIRTAIDEGYLKPLVGKETGTKLSTTGVSKRGGEFISGELQAAVDKKELNQALAAEIVQWGHDRRSWLVFATGVEHAQHLAEAIREHGIRAEVVVGDKAITSDHNRARYIREFKSFDLRCIVNCGTLTTGFNHPGLDLIGAARPTESAGLFVQIAGRGTRPVYAPDMPLTTADERKAAIAAGPCPNCLFLDFGGLVRRHGPIDLVQPRKPGKGGGDAPVKTCPECFTIVHASVTECPDCEYVWERQLSSKITKSAAATPILSKSEPIWRTVASRSFHRHEKFNSAPSMRVEYFANLVSYREWVSIEHPSAGARAAAGRWWAQHGGLEPVPKTVTEALERASELRSVSQIRIEASGKYWAISGRRFGEEAGSPIMPRIRSDEQIAEFMRGGAA